MSIQVLLAIIGGAISLLTFLGLVATFLRGSADRGTIVSLNNSVAALKIENELKTKSLADANVKIQQQAEHSAHQDEEIKTLRSVITQAEQIAKLTEILTTHHTESISLLRNIEDRLTTEIKDAGHG